MHNVSTLEGVGDAFLFLVVLFALYCIPAIIAYWRHHHDFMAIAATNLAFGWTALGWFVALIWALTATKGQQS